MNTHPLHFEHHDLVTPDGCITEIELIDANSAKAHLLIQNIAPHFVGYDLPDNFVLFNLKSSLAQIGLNATLLSHTLDFGHGRAELAVKFTAIGPIAREMLSLLEVGAYVGKLFAQDDRRRVRQAYYLERMLGRVDIEGRPLLSFGGSDKGEHLVLHHVSDHMVAFLKLRAGRISYDSSIFGFLPTLAAALKSNLPLRNFLQLHQFAKKEAPRTVVRDRILLVATEPLHIRTAFARVVEDLLPKGFHHTSANILQPNTLASGDIYELFGESESEIHTLPLEFFTLEPYREHVFFSDRDQLRHLLDDTETVFNAFKTAPQPTSQPCAVYVVKGSQLSRLTDQDWITTDPGYCVLPRDVDPELEATLVKSQIEQQPSFPFLKAMELGFITSQGVLFTRFFPTPLLKRLLLSYYVQSLLRGIYFQSPSRKGADYFSQEDRGMLLDLVVFGIPVYWVDEVSKQLLRFVLRPQKSSGMFVPVQHVETFRKATFFGIYGSNLLAGNFENELKKMLAGILQMRNEMHHPLLNSSSTLALVTGGGPGAMEVGNRMAKELGILSCAHVVDFRVTPDAFSHEQKQNPYIEAKMTYRLDQLIERQGEFYLDFPIFVMGGIGTDFELSLEELRHKVSSVNFRPIILFGDVSYWKDKITSRFHCNVRSGTIQDALWVSNCFFCIQTAEQGLKIYRDFLTGTLGLGKGYPPAMEYGFVAVD